MANIFNGTANTDTLTGLDTGGFNFFYFTPSFLQQADQVTGSVQSVINDILLLTEGGSVSAAQLSGVRRMEKIEFTSAQGNSIVLTNALASTALNSTLSVVTNAGNDVVNASAVTSGSTVAVFASGGTDTVITGSGTTNHVYQTVSDFNAADTIQGGTGTDWMIFDGAGTVEATAFQFNKSGVDKVLLRQATNITLSDAVFAPSQIEVVAEGAFNNVIDGSALTKGLLVISRAAPGGGIADGTDSFTGGSGQDFFVFASNDFFGDVVRGNAGIDFLVFQANGTYNADRFVNTFGIESINLQLDGAGSTIQTTNQLVSTADQRTLAVWGTTAAETLDGSQVTVSGAQVLVGGGGADVLRGGATNDWIRIGDANFAEVNGNGGFNRLETYGNNIELDLTTMSAARLSNIQAIDMRNQTDPTGALVGQNSRLNLTVNDLARVSGNYFSLYVLGDGDDVVNAGSGWTLVDANHANQVFDGINFLHYRQNGYSLYIQSDIGTATVQTGVVNQAPVVDLNGLSSGGFNETIAAYTTGSAAVKIAANASISDADVAAGDQITQMTVTISNATSAGETLSLSSGGAAIASSAGINVSFASGTLTLSGAAAVSQYEALLREVQYGNSDVSAGLNTANRSLQVTVVDARGESSTVRTATVPVVRGDGVAPEAPAISGISTDTGAAGDGVTGDNTLVVSGSAEAGSTVSIFNGSTLVGTGTANGSGLFSVTLSQALVDGAYGLTATAQDSAGNTSVASATFAVSIDTSAPIPPSLTGFSDDSGVIGDGRTSDTTPTLTGTAEAGSTVAIFNGSTQIGTVVATGAGTFSFTVPTALANGSYAFSARATDAAGNQSAASASLSVTVDATAPGAPVIGSITPDSGTTGDGITNTGTVIVSGTAEAGSTVTIFSGSAPVGSAVVNPDGTYAATITLVSESNTLTATATDAAGNTSAPSAPVSLTVDTTAPTVTSLVLNGVENQALVGALTATDASGLVTFSMGGGADSALFTIVNANQLRFLSAPNFEAPADGNADNTYVANIVATDAAGNRTTVAVNVTVGNVNEAPTAVADQATTNEDTAIGINVGQNDTDPDTGTVLDVTAATVRGGAAVGSVSFSGGSVTFTPAANFNGTAVIDYTISDGGLSSASTATVTVAAVNDAPVAVGNNPTVIEDTPTTLNVLANDIDVENQPLSIGQINGNAITVGQTVAVAGGMVLLNANQTLTFTPTANSTAASSFTYTARDSEGAESAPATVNVTITPVNDAPVVSTVILGQSVAEDNLWTFVLPTSAFTDVDGDTLTLTATLGDGSPLPSWLSFNGTTFSGQPPQDVNGSLSLKVTAADPSSATATQTFTLTVNPVNDAPVLGTPIAPQSVAEDNVWVFTVPAGSFSDIDGDSLTLTATLGNDDPLPSWLSFNGTTFSGQPPKDFNGTLTLKVIASDGPASVARTFTLDVTPVNDAPVATGAVGPTTTDEDTILTGSVAATDVDGTIASYQLVGAGPFGLVFNSDGTYSYDPRTNLSWLAPGQDATLSFAYKAIDNLGAESAPRVVSLLITGVNDNPVAGGDFVAAFENNNQPTSTATGGLLFNDFDTDGGTLSVSALLGGVDNGTTITVVGTYGTLTVTKATGAYQYVLDNTSTATNALKGGQQAPEVFTYSVSDGQGGTTNSTLTVNVIGANDIPSVPLNGAAQFNPTTGENSVVTVAAVDGLLKNVTDVDGTSTAAPAGPWPRVTQVLDVTTNVVTQVPNDNVGTVITLPGGGKLTILADGSYSFDPNGQYEALGAGQSTIETVRVVISDGAGGDVGRQLNIRVDGVNDTPVVGTLIGNKSVAEDNLWTFTVPANAFSDIDSATLTLTATLGDGSPLPSWLTFTGSTFVGQPPQDFNGPIELKVTASDGPLSASQTFTLDVTAVNDAPVVTGPVALTPDLAEDGPLTLTAAQLLANASDVESTTLTVADVVASTGTVVSNPNGTWTYTPPANFNGAVTFTYTVSDGTAAPVAASATLTVTPVNDAPVAGTAIGNKSVAEDNLWTFTVPANAFSDIDSATLTLTATLGDGSPLPSWLSFTGSTFVGQPPQDFNGSLSLKVTASDGPLSASQTFTLDVTAVNDAPVVTGPVALSPALAEDGTLTLTAAQLLANASDVDSTPLTVANVVASTGTVVSNPDGTWTYNPPADFNGAVTFTYTVSDGTAAPVAASATLTVTPVNDAPVAGAAIGTQSVAEDNLWTFTVPANAFSDIDSATLTLTATLGDGSPLPSWLSFTGSTFVGQPPQDFNGSLSLKVTASDGPLSASQTFTLDVTAVNDAPVFTSASAVTIDEGTTDVVTLAASDVDTPASGITFTITGGADQGKFIIVNDNELKFRDPTDFEAPTDANGDGTYEVIVEAYDGIDRTTQTIRVTDRDVNEKPSVTLAPTALAPTPNSIIGVFNANLQGTGSTIVDPERHVESVTLTLAVVAGADTNLDSNEAIYLDTAFIDALDILGFDVDFTATASTQTLTITSRIGGVSPAQLEGILENVKYANADTTFSFNPNDRVVTVTVTDDGGLTSDAQSLTIDLAANVTDWTNLNLFTGSNRDDIIRGLGGNDVLDGAEGADTLEGGSGDDRLTGGTGNDTLRGGSGTDTAVYSGNVAGYTFTYGTPVDGFITSFKTVKDNNTADGNEGVDTLTSVEKLEFAGGVTLDLGAPIQLFNGSTLVGTFSTIADALAASAQGYTILVSGTGGPAALDYALTTETITIPRGVTLIGLGQVTVAGITVNGSGGNVVIDNVDVTTTGDYGVYVDPTAVYASITFKNGDVTGGVLNGFAVNVADIDAVTIENATFSNNGTNLPANNQRGEGAILFEKFNGDVTLKDVEVTNPGAGAENGIQIRGAYPPGSPVTTGGTITLSDVKVTGAFSSTGIAIRDYTSLAGLVISDIVENISPVVRPIDGVVIDVSGTAYAGLHIDNVGGSFNLSDLSARLSVMNTSGNPLRRDIQLDGVTANSTLTGDSSNDLLVGATGGHTMDGGGGSDTYLVFANTTANTITDTGSSGVDSVLISGGDDPATQTLADGGTSDTLTVVYDGTSITSVNGVTVSGIEAIGTDLGTNGAAGDTLSYAGSSAAVTVDLSAGTATGFNLDLNPLDSVVQGALNIENVTGGAGNDTITLNAVSNTVVGGGGLDTVNTGLVYTDGMVTWDGVTASVNGGSGNIDTISGVGKLTFGSKTIFLVSRDADSDFTAIQDALNAAQAGDVVLVAAGTYNETVTVPAGVTLRASEPGAIINGQSGNGAVIIGGNGIVVDGFTINAGLNQISAVYLNAGVDDVAITDNAISASAANNNGSGIVNVYAAVTNITISGNTFTGSGAVQHIYINHPDSDSVHVTGNTFSGALGGGVAVGLESSNGSVTNNTFSGSSTYAALELWGANNDIGTGPTANDFTGFSGTGATIRTAQDDIDLSDTDGGVSATAQADVLNGGVHRDIALTGNAGDNVLTGNDGDNLLDGGGGVDTLIGGGGIDTAKGYSSAYSLLNDGTTWYVQANDVSTRENLTGIEKVMIGGTTYLLVDKLGANVGGFQTIQSAVDAADPGQIVTVADGTYTEKVVISEAISVQGLGSGAVIQGTFETDNPGSIGQDLNVWIRTAPSYSIAAGNGVSIQSSNVTLKNIAIDGFYQAVSLQGGSTLTDVTIDDVDINDSVFGIVKLTATAVDGLTIEGGTINDGYIGVYLYNNVAGSAAASQATDVTIDGTDFTNLTQKGIYAETLQGTTRFDNLQMTNVGQYGGGVAFGANGAHGTGIDVNLKYATYAGTITIEDFNFTGVGSSTGVDALGHPNAGAITIKGRNEPGHPDYSVNPADVSGLSVFIQNGTIDGTSTGIKAGEYKTNPASRVSGPAVTVTNVTIDGNLTNDRHDDVANYTTSVLTVNLTAGGDTIGAVRNAAALGSIVFNGGAGNDTLEGGLGADTFNAGGDNDTIVHYVGDGDDIVFGGSGNDSLVVRNQNPIVGTPSATQVTFAIGPSGSGFTVEYDGNGGADITAADVEDVTFVLGSGGDTVTIAGPLGGTGIATSTITVQGGSGDDVVDAGAIGTDVGTPYNVGVVFTGGDGNDRFVSGSGADVFDGGGNTAAGDTVSYEDAASGVSIDLTTDLSSVSATNVSGGGGRDRIVNVERFVGSTFDDTFTGDDGDNYFATNGGSDTVSGGDGVDTVELPLAFSSYTVTVGSNGDFTFTGGGTTIAIKADVENITAGGTTLDVTGDVIVLDAMGHLVGTFDKIGDAVDAASAGHQLLIKGLPTAYAENVTVDKALTFIGIDVGSGAPTVSPASGTAFNVTATGGNITFDNIDIVGGATGIAVAGSATINTLTVTNGAISGASTYGLFVDGPGANPGSVAEVVVRAMDFTNNGFGGANGAGHIKLWGFDGTATIDDVDIVSVSAGPNLALYPDNAIEITGQQNPLGANAPNLGTVVLTNVKVSGGFHKNPVAVFNISEIDGLSITGLDLTGATSSWGPLLNIDGVEDDVINASGFSITVPSDYANTFPTNYGIVTEIQGEKVGQDPGPTTITGTSFADRLVGKTGNDILIGGQGNDQLYGADKPGQPQQFETGNDRLEGGAGDDYLHGGAETLDGLATPSQGDVAVYRGAVPITQALLMPITMVDPVSGATFQGWQVNATGSGEGTDILNDVEIIENFDAGGAFVSRILLVGNGGFDSIQAAINEARDGDRIAIAANTYVEQVTVKNLNNITFFAVGGEVVIKAPADVVETARSSSDREMHSVVTVVNGTNIVFNKITVDGDGKANTIDEGSGTGQAQYTGVFYRNASGSLIDVDIKGVRDPYEIGSVAGGGPIVSGMQRGVGLQVDNDSELAFTMTGGSITDFQKNATVFNKANLTVTGVTITGGGAQTINAQNGIQVLNSTGMISGNTITKIGYAGSQNVYSGAILAYGNTGLAITNNTIVGANVDNTAAKVVGVYVFDAGPDNSGGRITGNIISHVDEGIDVSGDITPAQILIENNTVTAIDLGDQYAAGVWHEPTAALTTVFDVKGTLLGDKLYGAASNDTLTGLAGDDILNGRAGADTMIGGLGDDTYYVDNALDVVTEATGEGTDTVLASVDYALASGTEVEKLTSDGTGLTLTGNELAQTITGDAGVNSLNGGGGDDTLIGGAGGDTFDGGTGSDTIYGGTASADDANTVIDSVTYGTGATIAWNGTAWTVTDGGGTDTLYGIEKVVIDNAVHWLVDKASNDGLSTVASALALASANDTIHLGSGNFAENLTISTGVTILGARNGVATSAASRDASTGAGESTISGQWTIATTAGVVIDGLRFENVSPEGVGSDASLTFNQGGAGAGHAVRNTIFWSALDGGDTATNDSDPVRDDRAIHIGVGATTGTITVEDNLVTGSLTGKFGTASWGRGIWADYNGAAIVIDGNTFEYVRSGLNLDRTSALAAEPTVTGNTFKDAGTAITFGGGVPTASAGLASVGTNSFVNVDTEFNLRNLTSAVHIDLQTKIGSYSDTVDDHPSTGDYFYAVGNTSADTIKGSTLTDWLEGRAGNDILEGRDGDDVLDGGDGFDSLKGGSGNDLLVGGETAEVYTGTGQGDVAVYDTVITTSMVTSGTVDADPGPGVTNVAGWTIAAGAAEGSDTLVGIEIVQNGGSRILLVGNGGFSTIQAAINEATNGDTILIANSATPYAGAVVNKSGITIMGESEAGVVIGGSGSGTGLDIQASGVSIENLTISNFTYGIFVGTDVNNLTIDHVTSSGHLSNWQAGSLIEKAGLWIENGADVNGLTVRDSHFDGSDYGMYFRNSDTANESTLTNVTVLRTSFNNNAVKGLYAEKLSNATFDDVEVINSGHINSTMVSAQFRAVQSGFDINLKFADYQNITIKNSDFIDSGRYFLNNGANDLAAALTVKARDDGPTYGANKATLNGLTITGNTFQSTGKVLPNGTVDASGTATEVGLRLGETNADNAAFLGTIDISGNTFKGINTAYADETTGTVTPGSIYSTSLLIEGTLNDVDRSGLRELGDNLIVGADPAGNAIIGGKGNDYIVGGAGNDIITWNSGDGTDTVLGGAGTGDALVINGGTTAETFTVSTTSVTSSAGGGVSHTGIETVTVNAGNGNDTVSFTGLAGGPTMQVNGGADTDTLDFSALGGGVTASLSNGTFRLTGNPTVHTQTGVENLVGTDFVDDLTGDNGANRLVGGGGADTLLGLDGNDVMVGGDGADILQGGTGADQFHYLAASHVGDGLFGYSDADGDSLHFSAAFFLGGNQPAFDIDGTLSASAYQATDVNDALGTYSGFSNAPTFVLDTVTSGATARLYFDRTGDGTVNGADDLLVLTFDLSSNLAGFNRSDIHLIS